MCFPTFLPFRGQQQEIFKCPAPSVWQAPVLPRLSYVQRGAVHLWALTRNTCCQIAWVPLTVTPVAPVEWVSLMQTLLNWCTEIFPLLYMSFVGHLESTYA